MIAALCAAAAAFLLVPPTSHRRARALTSAPRRVDVPVEAWAAVAAGVGAVLAIGLPIGAIGGPVVAWVAFHGVRRLESAGERRIKAQIARQLPGVLDLIVAALRSGRPPAVAFSVAADAAVDPVAAEVRRVADLLALTSDPASVWRELATHPTLARVGRALHRADASGLPAARLLALAADEARRANAGELRSRARSIGVATAAPLGACFLPSFFLVGIVPTFLGLVGAL